MFQDAPKALPRLPRPGLQESNAGPVSDSRRRDGRSPSSRPPVRDIERLGGDRQPPSPRHERPSRPLEGTKRKPNNPHSFRSRCCLPAVVVVVSLLTLLHCHTCKVSPLPEVAGEELGSGTGHMMSTADHKINTSNVCALENRWHAGPTGHRPQVTVVSWPALLLFKTRILRASPRFKLSRVQVPTVRL
ncbi:hypothetical protein CMUS01_06069 [Colletotrichum musicola]|uniref:Uncharacterized protein n=1 Tax=Colletotrichum musicola TaxID=2175873 RepID=A0A8H6NJ87_9PEZI|nr:hypothetical protein CMUS01_06069 [Colletotrichum musicola]